MDFFFDISEEEMRRERAKGRELRKSRWWQNLIQKAQCYYCQTALDAKTATMDHIVPISRGGKSTRGNVVPACRDCNQKKESLTPVEWQEFLASLAKR